MDIYIKEVIKTKGLQLQQVAERIGYKSLPSFYRQINAPENISMKTLIKIADAAGCAVNDFFTDPSDRNEFSNTLICPHCGGKIELDVRK